MRTTHLPPGHDGGLRVAMVAALAAGGTAWDGIRTWSRAKSVVSMRSAPRATPQSPMTLQEDLPDLSPDLNRALHESAHGVAVLVEGGHLDEISIVPSRTSGGHCRWSPKDESAESRAVVILAGPMGEADYFRAPLNIDTFQTHTTDAREVRRVLEISPSASSRELAQSPRFQPAFWQALNLIQTHKHVIAAVARQLLARRTLTGREVRDIIGQ